ncbi:hypothetical protein, partial [Smaragdicoccus niigatensis]|uniref:8-oxoguanine DNA glycosylase OGG fold protein n=2 Tax=Smaragdicoccus niigatensis TaxID=359359 RepID=UPI0039F0A250
VKGLAGGGGGDSDQVVCLTASLWGLGQLCQPPLLKVEGKVDDQMKLNAPQGMCGYLSSVDVTEYIFGHAVTVNEDWWRIALAESGFGNGVLTPVIRRRDLFAMADEALTSPHGALMLLWNTLAWGTGTGARNNSRRIRAIAADREGCSAALMRAAQLARIDPSAAYEALRPSRNRNLIAYLGPAFFTKYLYVAGGGNADHRCVILDMRVASALRPAGWSTMPLTGWWTETYMRYIELLENWRDEIGVDRLDLLERWLFEQGRPPRARRR